MKASTTAVQDTLKKNSAVYAKPSLIAEWEYNRFSIPVVAITPAQTGNDEWLAGYGYPDSIAEPNRPASGIAKARLDGTVKPAAAFMDAPGASRFYPSSPDDKYVYWSSIQESSLTATSGSYAFSTPIQVTVTYPTAVAANKIVVGFETSYAKPVTWSIQTSVDGTNWVTAATNPALGTNGLVEIWRGPGAWAFTPDYTTTISIKAIRVIVYSMDKPSCHVDILTAGARLENDLSDFLESYSCTMEASSRSFIAPLGQASSNVGSISLSNIDSRFNNTNASSLYYGLIDKKVKFKLDLLIDASSQGGLTAEPIREFTMWADSWGGQDGSSVSVDLKDSSVILQEMDMPVVFFEDMTVGAVMWTILDKIGMSNYTYLRSTLDFGQTIPFYWPDDSQTVWDALSALAEATQTAVYFDENDVLQIRARKAMYSNKSINWNFDAVANGTKLPDIISVDTNYDLEANQVDVIYKPAAYSDYNNGFPKMETVWEPEDDTVVLRSVPLIKDLMIGGAQMWVRQADAIIWPYESDVNIGGEILHYKGKEYSYYEAGTLKTKTISTLDEKNALDALDVNLSWKNTFTGKFTVTARGLYGTDAFDHPVNSSGGYTSSLASWDNAINRTWPNPGATVMDGFLRLTNAPGASNTTCHIRRSNVGLAATGVSTAYYGMKFKFPYNGASTSTSNWNNGGLLISGDGIDSGFYLELCPTEQIDGWEARTWKAEMSLAAIKPNGIAYYIAPGAGGDAKGVPLNILYDTYYTVDVVWQRNDSTGGVQLIVYFNGVLSGVWFVAPSQVPYTEGRWGAFVRGPSTMDVDYMYAFRGDPNATTLVTRTPDDTSYLDLTTGGYTSGFMRSEIIYNFQSVSPYSYNNGRVTYFPQRVAASSSVFDEFGPVVHEVRKFDVKFKEENRPVGHSYLYFTNTAVESLYYESNAFGASFMLANAGRDNAIVKGDDTTTFGADNSVTQSLFVYGRSVYQEEEKTLTKKDDASIRRRGPTKVEFTSRFIQTEEMANEIGAWVISLWASGVDEVSIEIFGNPLIQIGDLVTINYPIKGMAPGTHKYFVVSIKNKFETGYSSTLTLRRAQV